MILEIIILIAQILLMCALVSYILWGIARGISGYTDSPFVATWRSMLPVVHQALAIRPGDVVYDLGCGDGRVLFYCAKRHPDATFIGVERNLLLIAFMHIKKFVTRSANVTICWQNLFDTDFSTATRLYVFLLPPVMQKLETRLAGKRVASRAFPILGRKESYILQLPQKPDKWNKHLLYVYE